MHQIPKKPCKASSIHEAEKSLKITKVFIKRDNFLNDSRPPLVENLFVTTCPKPRFVEKNITFKYDVIDMNKLADRLEQEGIGFVKETFGLKIGDHIHISERSIFIGVDAYPELTRIVSDCLVGPKKLASLMKIKAA